MITSRQRHKELMEYSLEDCIEISSKFGSSFLRAPLTIAMYEQKCLDDRTKTISENQIALEQLRHENYKKMEKIKRQPFKSYDATPKRYE